MDQHAFVIKHKPITILLPLDGVETGQKKKHKLWVKVPQRGFQQCIKHWKRKVIYGR